jgi:hypothetical protein
VALAWQDRRDIPRQLAKYLLDGMRQVEEDFPRPADRLKMLLAWALGFTGARSLAAFRRVLEARRFVVLPTFIYEMLHLHERYLTGRSLIIESQTGVGKTFKLEVLAALMNEAMSHNQDHPLYANIPSQVARMLLEVLEMLYAATGWLPAVSPIAEGADPQGRYDAWKTALEEETLTPGELEQVADQLGAAAEDPRAFAASVREFVLKVVDGNKLLQVTPEFRQFLDDEALVVAGNPQYAARAIAHLLRQELRPLVHRMLVHPDLRKEEVRGGAARTWWACGMVSKRMC